VRKYDIPKGAVTSPNVFGEGVHIHHPDLGKWIEAPSVLTNPRHIVYRGFPQGGGLSPVMFNFAFSVALTSWLSQFPGARLIAYADDFLVFSKKALTEVFRVTKEFVASGLEFSVEKSRLLKENGKWMVPSFRFLGNTVESSTGISTASQPDLSVPVALRATVLASDRLEEDTAPEGTLMIKGTPRSGAVNLPLPPFIHKSLAERDKGLWDLLSFKWGKKENLFASSYGHPQAVLNAWGRHEFPANLIPREIIDGSQSLLRGHAYRLVRAAYRLATSSPNGTGYDGPIPAPDLVSPGLQERLEQVFRAGNLDLFAWLSSRYAGFQQSLLFAPAENAENTLYGRKVFEPKFPLKGRNFVSAAAVAAPQLDLSIYNASSYANLALLKIQAGEVSPKLRRGLRSARMLPGGR
jgi:hypothetical protein